MEEEEEEEEEKEEKEEEEEEEESLRLGKGWCQQADLEHDRGLLPKKMSC